MVIVRSCGGNVAIILRNFNCKNTVHAALKGGKVSGCMPCGGRRVKNWLCSLRDGQARRAL